MGGQWRTRPETLDILPRMPSELVDLVLAVTSLVLRFVEAGEADIGIALERHDGKLLIVLLDGQSGKAWTSELEQAEGKLSLF